MDFSRMSGEISELEGAKEVAEERLAAAEGDVRELKDELSQLKDEHSQVWFLNPVKNIQYSTKKFAHAPLLP
jgi:chromosome segregation ATPase